MKKIILILSIIIISISVNAQYRSNNGISYFYWNGDTFKITFQGSTIQLSGTDSINILKLKKVLKAYDSDLLQGEDSTYYFTQLRNDIHDSIEAIAEVVLSVGANAPLSSSGGVNPVISADTSKTHGKLATHSDVNSKIPKSDTIIKVVTPTQLSDSLANYGKVKSVSVTTANHISGTVANATTYPAITITPDSSYWKTTYSAIQDTTKLHNQIILKATQFPGICAETPITESNLSIDYGTRILTVTPTVTNWCYYVDGSGVVRRYPKTGAYNFPAWSDISGYWYLYFDKNGNGVTSQTQWVNFDTVATVYRILWNATLSGSAKSITEVMETHLNTIPGTMHYTLHLDGSKWATGGELANNFLATGSPNADGRNTCVSLTSVTCIDDNLQYTVTNSTGGLKFQQDLGNTNPALLTSSNSGQFKIRYQDAGGLVYTLPATRFPFAWDIATNRPQYITSTGTRTLVLTGDFFVYFVYSLQDPRNSEAIRIVSAPSSFGTLTDAQNYTWASIQSTYSNLNDNEIRPLYKLIFLYLNSYSASCKYAVLRGYTDIRKASVTQTTVAAGSINASAVNVVPAGNIASTNAQAALQELDNEKFAYTDTSALLLKTRNNIHDSLNFGDNILDWYYGLKTYKPYANRTATGGKAYFYLGSTLPNGTDSLSLNGRFFAPYIRVSGGSGYSFEGSATSGAVFYATASSGTAFNGTVTSGYGISASASSGAAGLFQQYGSSSSANPVVELQRNVGGTANITGNVLSIIDNPSTSGTKSGAAINVNMGTGGSLKNVTSINPRATRLQYIFGTYNNANDTATIAAFKDSSLTPVRIKANGLIIINETDTVALKSQLSGGYTLPTMAALVKGGAKKGFGLTMNGDSANVDSTIIATLYDLLSYLKKSDTTLLIPGMQQFLDSLSNKLALHGKADSAVIADNSKLIQGKDTTWIKAQGSNFDTTYIYLAINARLDSTETRNEISDSIPGARNGIIKYNGNYELGGTTDTSITITATNKAATELNTHYQDSTTNYWYWRKSDISSYGSITNANKNGYTKGVEIAQKRNSYVSTILFDSSGVHYTTLPDTSLFTDDYLPTKAMVINMINASIAASVDTINEIVTYTRMTDSLNVVRDSINKKLDSTIVRSNISDSINRLVKPKIPFEIKAIGQPELTCANTLVRLHFYSHSDTSRLKIQWDNSLPVTGELGHRVDSIYVVTPGKIYVLATDTVANVSSLDSITIVEDVQVPVTNMQIAGVIDTVPKAAIVEINTENMQHLWPPSFIQDNSYSWTGVASGTNKTASVTTSGYAYCQVTDNYNGCQTSDTIYISSNVLTNESIDTTTIYANINNKIPYNDPYKGVHFAGRYIDSLYLADHNDTTRRARFNMSQITTGNARTITIPDRDFTMNDVRTTTTTNLIGLLKGNGSNIALASAGTDYQSALTNPVTTPNLGVAGWVAQYGTTTGIDTCKIYVNGHYVGLGTSLPTKNLSFDNSSNKIIGIESTINTIAGKNLTITAGNTVNVGSGTFDALNQVIRNWTSMITLGSNVYASVGNGDIYKQTGGIGDFAALGQTTRAWSDMDTLNGNVYACVYGGDIYMQTGGTGNFVALGQTTRDWIGMASLSGNIYACVYGGDIYMQTGGTGNFVALGQTSRNWHDLESSGGNVYACVFGGDIYMQTGGTGNFVALGQTTRNWTGMTSSGGNVYACVFGGDIYLQTGGSGNFVALGQTSRNWYDLNSLSSNLYACVFGGDIYMQTSGAGTINLAGGNLILQTGVGKGNASESIIFQVAKTLISGTDIQTLEEKLKINGDGTIGIATSTPKFALDINGSARIIDDYSFNLGGTTTSASDYVFTIKNNSGYIDNQFRVDASSYWRILNAAGTTALIYADPTLKTVTIADTLKASVIKSNTSTFKIVDNANKINMKMDSTKIAIYYQNDSLFRVKKDTVYSHKTFKIASLAKEALRGVITTSDYFVKLYKNATLKFSIDSAGYIHNDMPHALSQFTDSSVTITLTQNVWVQVTNSTKTLWPTTKYVGFTESGDSTINGYSGDFTLKYQVNILEVDAKDYEYRLQRKRGATTTDLWHYKISSSGKVVLRHINRYIDAQAGDRYWIELRSTSSAPGNVTIYGGEMECIVIHLD